MSISTKKLRRAATKGVSVALSATTSLWLAGSSMFFAVPAAHAADEVVVTDVTGDNPRIAADGESERVFLGLNVLTSATSTDTVHLQTVQVDLVPVDSSPSGDEREATAANIETVRVYSDSSLTGTNGTFDENDGKLDPDGDQTTAVEITRSTGVGDDGTSENDDADSDAITNSTLLDQAQAAGTALASTGALTANQTTKFCADSATEFAVGDVVAVLDNSASATSHRVITAASLNLGAATDGCAAGDDLYTLDTAISSRTADDTADTIQDLTNYPAGITAIALPTASDADVTDGEAAKIGTGATAEIRNLGTTGVANVWHVENQAGTNTPTTFAHANTDTVVELANDEIADGAGNGFLSHASNQTEAEWGDPGDQTNETHNSGFSIPRDDDGNNAGNDLFVVLVTKGGVADQKIKAQVFGSGSVEYNNENGNVIVTPTVASGASTTDGTTKEVTFGADGVAPTIQKVETYDNTPDGKVDRVKVFFSESMATSVTATDQFEDADGNPNEIEAGATDISLGTIAWSTTTNLNDTATIDFSNVTYTDATQSTGDSWSVKYDREDVATDLRDATGEKLNDATVTTADKAKPYLVSALVKDTDANQKVDTLEATFSESLGSASTSSGLVLKETAIGSSTHTYTLGSIASFKQSTGSDSNAGDTAVVSITERADNDVTGTFTLDYTPTTTIVDAAGNQASSRTGLSVTVSVAPVVTRVEILDECSGHDGSGGCTAAGANGKIDTAKVTFSRTVDTDYTAGANATDWTVAGYSTLKVKAGSSVDGTTTLEIRFDEKTFDTDAKPDVTYVKSSGDTAQVCVANTDNDCQPTTDSTTDTPLEDVTSGKVTEEDKAGPFLRTATLYETTANDIWESGETIQALFSEPIDPASIASSWANETFTDWTFSAGTGTDMPDTGNISTSGKVVVFTPDVSASAALSGTLAAATNEVKDAAGNSAGTGTQTITLTPTTAPSVDRVETRDMNGNGIVDALQVEFDGLVDVSTLVAGDFAAARDSNFSTNSEGSFSNASEVTPDLTVSSVTTANSGNDTRVWVSFNENPTEDTGKRPQVKYVQGSAADLAGNKVASFNQGGDNTKFATANSTNAAAFDGAVPQVVVNHLKDRNSNGKYDQLAVVFSEAMTITNTATSGWNVQNHILSSSGTWSSNNAGVYDSYTFANSNNIFSVDILENGTPTAVPDVTYASTGAFKDANSLPLGDVAAGKEKSDIAISPGFSDGDMVRESSSSSVWILKHVGTKKFRRHVLTPMMGDWYAHLSPFWSKVQVVADGSVMGPYSLSAWVRGAGQAPVWEVNDDGTKHHITCDDDTGQEDGNCTNEWLNAGGDPDGVYTVNQAELDYYATSNPVVLPNVAD